MNELIAELLELGGTLEEVLEFLEKEGIKENI